MNAPVGGFEVPVYPFDQLRPIAELAASHPGGLVDLSIGTPCDPPPPMVLDALAHSDSERGYPPGVGSPALLDAARAMFEASFSVSLERTQLAACVGTKEFVAGLPHWLRLRSPGRDTVLYPAIAYPTYEMGALLAGCRAVPVPTRPDGALALEAIDPEDAARSLCLYLNSPSNPTGALDDLAAGAAWGREHGVLVCSDECYADFTWTGAGRSILEHGHDGVLALHSLSKRSNCAGLRVGVYAGDGDVVHYLAQLRRHAGLLVPGPVQAAAAAAWSDAAHVVEQRARYLERLERLVAILKSAGIAASMPAASFYLWVAAPPTEEVPEGGARAAWRLTKVLAGLAGALVSPGEFFGPDGAGFVRLAVVQPLERIELIGERLARAGATSIR